MIRWKSEGKEKNIKKWKERKLDKWKESECSHFIPEKESVRN